MQDMTLCDKTKNINYLTCTSVNYYITIIFLYIQVKVCNECAFLNRLEYKCEGAENVHCLICAKKGGD